MKDPGNADTIAAIATPPGNGGIGIVRVSGPRSVELVSGIFRGRGGRSLEAAAPRLLLLGEIVDPATGEPIDEVLAVKMPAGRSYTGEPTVEIHGHGGTVVLDGVLRATLEAGARLARPGEFTKRAFLSGRIDLTQAEAIAELIAAESEEEGRAALRQAQGGLGPALAAVRDRLLALVADAEALLDFEEDDAGGDEPCAAAIAELAADVRKLSALGREQAREAAGARIVFAGRPNSGKSCLFNKLLNCERSIVSANPGTTRDYVADRAIIGGSLLTLVDTAGLRPSDDQIEREGVLRSLRQIADADLVVLLIDGSVPADADDLQMLDELLARSPVLVISKADLPERIDRDLLARRAGGLPVFSLSAITGDGCAPFVEELVSRCGELMRPRGGCCPAPNRRHQDALRRAAEHLDRAARMRASRDRALDQAAADLRAALTAIGEITGETVTEEILERIFSRFCVGK